LLNSGALSVTLTDSRDQPIFEPGPGETPIWNEVAVVGLYDIETNPAYLRNTLENNLPDVAADHIDIATLEDQDWERAWMVDFKPMCFANRFWVCPTGFDVDAPDGVIMELDPGLAFGTGTHPTTAMCLEWLAGHDIKGMTMIDYGCGSGILGIAALLLGADHIYGVDNDPQALLATHDNCGKNHLNVDRFPCYLPADFAQALTRGDVSQVDMMLANILAGPLVSLAQYLAAMVRPGGGILLSGILREQADEVASAYSPWFDMAPPVFQEDWTRLEGQRKP